MEVVRVTTASRVLIGVLLAVAGGMKLMEPGLFAVDIANYRLVPFWLEHPLAYILPPLELVVAVGLFHPRYEKASWLLACSLFAGFALVVSSALIRGLDVSCGCFGTPLPVTKLHLLGNIVLSAISYRSYLESLSDSVKNP